MKKKPYTAKTSGATRGEKWGKEATMMPAITRARVVQRPTPRSLRPPKRGLLMAEAMKIMERIPPVDSVLRPWAFWRKSEPRLPMELPVKSRRLKAKAAAMKKSQRAGEGKSCSDGR